MLCKKKAFVELPKNTQNYDINIIRIKMVDKLTDDFEVLDVDYDGELSDIAVDLLVLAQQLIEAKVRLEQMTKVHLSILVAAWLLYN